VSQRKWLLLGVLLLAVGVGGGWLLKSFTASEMSSSSPTTTRAPSTETITVTIADEAVQIGSDQTGHIETGHKGSVKVPDAELEKLALLLRPPSQPLVSTWGPPISALIVAGLALSGVIWAADKAAKTANKTEWFRRFEEMLDLLLSPKGNRSEVGGMLLAQHVKSTLAGAEERNLALSVLEQVMKPALERAGVAEPAKPGQSDTHFVVSEPPQSS
jgi:hypothetical protein